MPVDNMPNYVRESQSCVVDVTSIENIQPVNRGKIFYDAAMIRISKVIGNWDYSFQLISLVVIDSEGQWRVDGALHV